jgi:hypothetical protein
MASLVATAAVRFAGEGAGGSRDANGSERWRSGSGAVGIRRDDAELRNGYALRGGVAFGLARPHSDSCGAPRRCDFGRRVVGKCSRRAQRQRREAVTTAFARAGAHDRECAARHSDTARFRGRGVGGDHGGPDRAVDPWAASAQRLADELGTIADENSRLYATQRTVAQTLQRSLLPQRLPEIAGHVLAVRYMPGVAGVDIACVSTKRPTSRSTNFDALRVGHHLRPERGPLDELMTKLTDDLSTPGARADTAILGVR